jgi:hypothetical protein
VKALLVAFTVVVGLSCGLGTASGAGRADPDPFRDQAQRIACPAAPPGWSIPPGDETGDGQGGREILTPLTVVPESGPYGGDAVEVDCDYFAAGNRHLRVGVRYALPVDPNPINDFYFGCSASALSAGLPNGGFAWNAHDRIFRVVGSSTWSVATFYDFLQVLRGDEVTRFEAVTRELLGRSAPAAHGCPAPGSAGPVATRTIWDFGFALRVTSKGVTTRGGTEGSFVTTASPAGGPGVISRLSASEIVVATTPKGARRAQSTTIRIGRPLDFQARYGATLRAAVQVVASTYPPCRVGATGTLTVSTMRFVVQLDVCGRNLVQGDGPVSMHIDSV